MSTITRLTLCFLIFSLGSIARAQVIDSYLPEDQIVDPSAVTYSAPLPLTPSITDAILPTLTTGVVLPADRAYSYMSYPYYGSYETYPMLPADYTTDYAVPTVPSTLYTTTTVNYPMTIGY